MEQRRTRRFKLELPLSITRAGAERVALVGLTKNISSCGVLFTTGKEPDLGGPIEYVITLASDGLHPVNLRCVGKVLRTERTRVNSDQERRAFQIAATLERYEFVRERDLSVASSQTATRARLSD
jgi:PilZ domain